MKKTGSVLCRYFTTLWVIVLLRAADLYITFLITPDLESEWNPFVSLFDATWRQFIAFQIILVAIIGLFMAFYFRGYLENVSTPGLSYVDFIYRFFHDDLKPWPQRLWAGVTRKAPHLIFIGFMVAGVSLAVSAFAILNNLLLLLYKNSFYSVFVFNYHQFYFLFVFISIVIVTSQIFFLSQYTKYRTRTETS